MRMRDRFFNKKFEFLTLRQVLEITGAKTNEQDLDKMIYDIATLKAASAQDISFVNSGKYLEEFLQSKAGFCLVDEKSVEKFSAQVQGMVLLAHPNPYFAYAKIAAVFYEENPTDFSEKSIHPTAKITEGTKVAPNAYVGKNVEIGKNCIIAPGAVIMAGCIIGDNSIINANAVVSFATIGNNCIIHNGAKIGQDGFGFAHNAGINHKIIQVGIVEIGNHVEIGANSCIDRGAIENTVIGDDVKIDNLVQIGHNVVIGRGSVFAGCSAIAGSTKIGQFVQVGGSSGIGGHITIGDGVRIAGMSGIMRDVAAKEIIAGAPSLPIRKWHKLNAILMKMVGE